MQKSDFSVDQEVYFGRENGEKTLGKIVKMNPTKAVIETLENRGNGRGAATGAQWRVPYGMLIPKNGAAVTPVVPQTNLQKIALLSYSIFMGIQNQLMEVLLQAYSELSPESLTCDGEASQEHIRNTRIKCAQVIKGVTIALGFEVSESEVYQWHRNKQKFDDEQRRLKKQDKERHLNRYVND